ncbi:MAG TPA: ATP-binding protein [Chloroflexota bacterium]|nr:ATP-binding protein [Chloroflexota bacterium]
MTSEAGWWRVPLPRWGRRRAARPRRRRGLSLRVRLALLSTSLLGVTLVVFSVVVYFAQARTLAEEVDRALVDRAEVIASAITVSGSGLGPGVELQLPDADALTSTGTLVQFVNLQTGDIEGQSELLSRYRLALPVSAEVIAAARGGAARFERVQVSGVTFRLYSRPLLLTRVPIGLVQVARPIEPIEETIATLRLVLIAGTAGSVALSTLLGLLVASAALRPIGRLTREAEQIGRSQDFGRRVTARGADEVARLATTFNEMLGQLQSAYASLQSVNSRLAAALESQRRFVADASHELRTPLTTVRGNASLLSRFDQLTPEDRRAVTDQIASEAERMTRLVGDLLTLARADAGQSLRHERVRLAPLLQDVARQGRMLADGKVSVRVLPQLGEAAEAAAMGDPDALRQLVLILVDNAVKYTPAGGAVTLGLRVEGNSSGGQVAKVSVVDTGIGIARADLPHVFERFYRADRARQTGGTGLGLAIGKWIAEAHGGQIDVESELGAGSIFTVTLPVTAGTAEDERAGQATPTPAAQAAPERPAGGSSPLAAGATSRYTSEG